jgi:GWxTD domain-containing protein
MKRLFFLLLPLIATLGLQAQNMEGYFHHAAYDSPEGPYIETYLSIIGNTATFIKTDKGYQAEIEITMLFKLQDSISEYKKYLLKSPVIKDSTARKPNFLDVQRIPLKHKEYSFEVSIRDANNPTGNFVIEGTPDLTFPENKLAFSGFQPVESFTESDEESVLVKNGIKMIPYVSNFYPGNTNMLNFYIELYNTDKAIGEPFLLRYFIREYESKELAHNLARTKRKDPGSVTPLLGQFNIEDLPSGNYELVVEARNKENESLAETSYFIQRSKPLEMAHFEEIEDFEMNKIFAGDINNKDSLNLYIKSLRPIANEQEKVFIDRNMIATDIKFMKRFFYTFWNDRNPVEPGNEWQAYKKQVENVDRLFGTRIYHGFETDRGRVYLEYGPPNDSYKNEHEPSAYPYEIWSYYRAGDQRNKKFVFYNPNLAGNNYELLHSNVRGELQTPNWERYLSKRNNDLFNHDVMQSDDQWGSRAKEYYDSH